MRALILCVFVSGLLITGNTLEDQKTESNKINRYKGHILQTKIDSIELKKYKFKSWSPIVESGTNYCKTIR